MFCTFDAISAWRMRRKNSSWLTRQRTRCFRTATFEEGPAAASPRDALLAGSSAASSSSSSSTTARTRLRPLLVCSSASDGSSAGVLPSPNKGPDSSSGGSRKRTCWYFSMRFGMFGPSSNVWRCSSAKIFEPDRGPPPLPLLGSLFGMSAAGVPLPGARSTKRASTIARNT